MDNPFRSLSRSHLETLIRRSEHQPHGRVTETLSHPDYGVQQVIQAIRYWSYVQPHNHRQPELVYVHHGAADLVIFDDSGSIKRSIPIGAEQEWISYCVDANLYHTVIARTECAVVHNIREGPHNHDYKNLARWAPHENSPQARGYFENLKSLISPTRHKV